MSIWPMYKHGSFDVASWRGSEHATTRRLSESRFARCRDLRRKIKVAGGAVGAVDGSGFGGSSGAPLGGKGIAGKGIMLLSGPRSKSPGAAPSLLALLLLGSGNGARVGAPRSDPRAEAAGAVSVAEAVGPPPGRAA